MTKSFDIARKMSKEPLAVTDLSVTNSISTATVGASGAVDAASLRGPAHDIKDLVASGQYYRLQSTNGALEFYFWNGSTWALRARLAADGKFYAVDVGIL